MAPKKFGTTKKKNRKIPISTRILSSGFTKIASLKPNTEYIMFGDDGRPIASGIVDDMERKSFHGSNVADTEVILTVSNVYDPDFEASDELPFETFQDAAGNYVRWKKND